MAKSARPNSIAWLQLMRLPNVFTAAADVMMGFIVTHGDLEPVQLVATLIAASCLLYLSGMVLNDVFDAEADVRERSERPIPSGRVSLKSATAVGWGMLASGVLVAWYAGYVTGFWRPGAVATLLAICIVLYDAVLKRTVLAPLLMGGCRALNVLLGMSVAAVSPVVPGIRALGAGDVGLSIDQRPWHAHEWLIALGIGVYIIGVTIFARTEARVVSSRARLITGLAVLLAGTALLAAVPALTENDPPLVVGRIGWYLLWGALALITTRRCVLAINEPTPPRVQAAVRHGVQSIIVLDAAVCIGYVGPIWGLVVFALIFPTLLLAAWLKAT